MWRPNAFFEEYAGSAYIFLFTPGVALMKRAKIQPLKEIVPMHLHEYFSILWLFDRRLTWRPSADFGKNAFHLCFCLHQVDIAR